MVVLPSAVRFLAATTIAAVSFIKAVDGCTQLQVNVKTDDYPEETSWQLVDTCTGNTVASRSYFAAKNTQYSNSYCLPSRYQFTIKDSYGDGLCCGYGYGSYSVVWDGVVKVSGGYFGFSQTTTFGSCPTPPPTKPPTPFPTAHVSLCSSLRLKWYEYLSRLLFHAHVICSSSHIMVMVPLLCLVFHLQAHYG